MVAILSADELFDTLVLAAEHPILTVPLVICEDGEERSFYAFIKWDAEQLLEHAGKQEFYDLLAVIDLAIEEFGLFEKRKVEQAFEIAEMIEDNHECTLYPCDTCDA